MVALWWGGCPLAVGQTTTRVSLDSSGAEGNDESYMPSISADGRFVAFSSDAANLVPGDTNGRTDVFVHDRRTGATTRVSVDSAGVEGDGTSWNVSISADGRLVAFDSRATNLVPGDTNRRVDVFVHDRQSGTTSRVSVDSSGVQGNGDSEDPGLSADGRWVVFHSVASNLVPGDGNGRSDVFVHDLSSGSIRRVSVDSAGVEGDDDSEDGCLSADGRFVAFDSIAGNLAPQDSNFFWDVFVHDLLTGSTTLVSVAPSGWAGHGFRPSISRDGRFVAFDSYNALVAGDANGWLDVYVRDLLAGTTTLASVDSSGGQGNQDSGGASLSSAGDLVAFESYASNLVPGDTNGTMDVFLRDLQAGTTVRVSVRPKGGQARGFSAEPEISADGRLVAFDSTAADLVPGDTNRASDVFVRGPRLVLEANPETAPPGANLVFDTWQGLPGGRAMLALVDVNGTPVFQGMALGRFDAAGLWSWSLTVPPGLSGSVLGFLGLGVVPTGAIELSNREQVAFP